MLKSPMSTAMLLEQLEAQIREGQELSPAASRCVTQVMRHVKGIVSALEVYLASAVKDK